MVSSFQRNSKVHTQQLIDQEISAALVGTLVGWEPQPNYKGSVHRRRQTLIDAAGP
jgi:hypothetical protein